MTADAPLHISDAEPPFDDSSADMILRSSDGIDFRVHASILAAVSPVFQDMASLGGPTAKSIDETRHSLPVCSNITEDGATLRALLFLCYPFPTRPIPTLDGVLHVFSVALKYQMEDSRVCDELKKMMRSFAGESPLRVYTFSVIRGFEDEARYAAWKSLHHDIFDLAALDVPGLSHAPPTSFQRLVQYWGMCRNLCTELCTGPNFPWIPIGKPFQRDGPLSPVEWDGAGSWQDCKKCPCDKVALAGGTTRYVKRWWLDFLKQAKEDLERKPCSDTLHRRELFEIAFKGMIDSSDCRCRTLVGIRDMDAFVHFMASEIDRRTVEIASQMSFKFS